MEKSEIDIDDIIVDAQVIKTNTNCCKIKIYSDRDLFFFSSLSISKKTLTPHTGRNVCS